MFLYDHATDSRPAWQAMLFHTLLQCISILACLLIALPAHAHEDDAPPTADRLILGMVVYVAVVVWLLVISFRARLPIRKRVLRVRRRFRMRRSKP